MSDNTSASTATLLPGIDLLGAGYDIFGDYASPASVKKTIIDWKTLLDDSPDNARQFPDGDWHYPKAVTVAIDYGTTTECKSGSDVQEYQYELGVSAGVSGGVGCFSGSVSSNFSTSETSSKNTVFSRVQQSVKLWTLSFMPDLAALDAYIDPNLKTAFEEATDEDHYKAIFDTWGSHFLSGIVMGGRAVYTSATDSSDYATADEVRVAASASYGAATGQVTADASTDIASKVSTFRSRSNSYQEIRGGDVGKQAGVFSGEREGFEEWNNTVEQKPVFVAFNGDRSLTGIWELCSDVTKRESMKNYFPTWGHAESLNHLPVIRYIDTIGIVSGDDDDADAPGFTKLTTDLNQDAGGTYMYMYYHSTDYDSSSGRSDYPECITDVQVINGEDTAVPAGYTKIDRDLNEDAGGDYLFLCYKKEPCNSTNVQNAITDLYVQASDSGDFEPRYGYQRLPTDLNKNAGGDYVYLYYKKAMPA